MSFNSSITPTNYAFLINTRDARSQSSDSSDYENNRVASSEPVSLRYDRRELNILKADAFEAYELYKKIPESHRAEEFARDMIKVI